MKIFKTLLLAIIAQVSLVAQDYAIKGQIQDPDKNNLIGAVVVALNPSDSVMVSYAVTDESGIFNMTDITKGKFRLQITYIGFGTLEKTVELTPQQKVLDLGLIKMLQEGAMLDAVTISAEYVPIKITKDTLEFTAEAFKTQPNAVVEDLLKKLPGVEVEADGTIKVKGEEVRAVTVDGKDFFGKDPKMATRNLPANAVKKVQVFEKKSKNAEFTGVDDGQEETTINLELKEDKRNGLFGNISGGVGTDSRYEGKSMINRFAPKTQVSIIGTLNNLNNTGISAGDFGTMTGSSGRNMNNTGAPVSFGPNNNGETNSATLGMNINNQFGKRNRVNFSYFLTQSETDLIQNSFTNSFLPTGALISNKFSKSNTDALNHNFYSSLDLRIDSTSEVNMTGNLAIRGNDRLSSSSDSTSNTTKVLLNRNAQKRDNTSESTNYGFTLNFRKRLKKRGRTLTFDSGYGNNSSESINQLLSEVYGRDLLLNTKSSVFQDQEQFSGNINYNLGASYTEPLNTSTFLTTSLSQRNNKTDLIKDFFNLNPENTDLRTFNEELSRTFDNSFRYTTAGTNIRFNKETYSFSAGVDYQNSALKGLPSVGEEIDRSFNYFLPKFNLELDNLHIRVNYSTSVREPSMDQLQPVLDNTDPLNLYQGNPNLVPEYRHSMRIMYHHFDQFNFRSIFANVRLGYTKNRITTSSFFDPELFIRTQNPVNTDSEKSMASTLSFSSPLNVIKAKYRININSSVTNGINFINKIENEINRWSNGVSFTLENKSKNKIDISATTRLNYTQNIYKENESLNTDFLNQTYEGYFAWFAGKGWTIDTRYEMNVYGQGSFGEATTIKLWQASLSKNFMENKINAKLRVFDILNQNQGVSRTASETNISESISNSIGQYFMLSCTYNINALGAPKQSNRMEFMRSM
jgi:hypothetical protein